LFSTDLLLATLLWTNTLCAAFVLSKHVLHEICKVLVMLPKSLTAVRQAGVKSQLCIAAMILERIVGRDVSKPISSKRFHDIHYLRQMLFCVFSALHQAQKKLAFHHADLRLPNIRKSFQMHTLLLRPRPTPLGLGPSRRQRSLKQSTSQLHLA